MDRLEGLFSDLSATFEAAIERHENEAAADLALSISQDIDLHAALTDGDPVVAVVDGMSRTVLQVGKDYLVAEPGDLVIPISNVVLVRPSLGPRPALTRVALSELLRTHVREGTRVRCSTRELELEGPLTAVARDHLAVGGGFGRKLVPLGSVRWIRFVRGGSVGVP